LLYPAGPSLLYDLLGLIGLVPLARLLPPLLPRSEHKFVYALVVLYVVDKFRDLIGPLVTLERLLFMLEMGSIALVLGLLLRPGRVGHLPGRGGLLPFTGIAVRIAMLMFAVAVVTNALGSTAFSLALGGGVFLSVYVALVLYGVYRVIDGIIAVMLRSGFATRLNMVRNHRALVARRILQVVRIGFVLTWGYLTAGELGIWSWLVATTLAALQATMSVGDLTFSPGGVVTFLLVFMVALYLSKLLRFTLEQDVLPRMRLPRGVPYAITATLHYGILFVALMAALAAAGIDLSKFSLLAGALGVGVGFGLQNIVNNFISGLVLLFERPIQTNDVVEVGTLLGKVKRIGIRSSTVRTLDGAEVIVPNANLISDQVVNWTLSDRQRRIDVNIGVKYGTDPERVLALLQQVAEEDDRVLDHPAPDALFVGFGNSSLDFLLRAWTPGFDEWIQIRSDLNVAVNRALAEAGIEIPFPQRDLHLRSISEDAAARFRSDEDES
jgi:small-conductance mechanosensitive channel